MKDGRTYRIQPCVEPEAGHTVEFLKEQIARGLDCMSTRSRWHRFATPLKRLSSEQLAYLADLDGRNRVAWCATIQTDSGERGIALGRYVRLENEPSVAEFALAVVDEFQGQGVGFRLMNALVFAARKNGISTLRGCVLASNRHMLSLCRRFGATLRESDAGSTLTVEVDTKDRSLSSGATPRVVT
jgi:acetyltransferase